MALSRPSVVTMDGIALTNPSRQAMRIMLLLGCVFLVLAAIVLALQRADPARFAVAANTPASTACLVVLALCGPGALAMLLSALITLRPVLVTDRIFDQFRRGDMLADWRFTSSEWDRYVDAEVARLGQGGVLAGLWLVGPFAVVAAITLWTVYPTGQARVEAMTVVAGVAMLALWLLRQMQTAFHRKRIATLRRNPRVLIGGSSIYCGGFFKPWNVSMLVLQRARLLPGPPMMLEVTIGAGQAVQAADTVLAIASLAGGSGGGTAQSMRSQMLVPVPADRHDEAARVMQELVSPPPLTNLPTRRIIAAGPAPGQGRGGRHWWAVTAIMFVAGFGLFLLGAAAHDPLDAALSSMGTAASVAGLFLWIGGLVTAVVAVMGSIHSYRLRRRIPTAAP